jgi:hypothetical protein
MQEFLCERAQSKALNREGRKKIRKGRREKQHLKIDL